MRAALLLMAGCFGAVHPIYHPDVLQVVDTDGEKAVQIVSDERMPDHEPRPVPESAVASALIASGMFLDEDARTLAGPVSNRLATMQTDEAVRIVGWAEDAPRYYYVLVHHGRIQIMYYAGSRHADDYSGVIPTNATPIHAPAQSVANQPPPAPPDAGMPPPEPTPAPTPAPRPRRPHTTVPGYTPIPEAEARRRLQELDEALHARLISDSEYRTKRKEILARL
jgi:hypothetical protein